MGEEKFHVIGVRESDGMLLCWDGKDAGTICFVDPQWLRDGKVRPPKKGKR